MAVGGLTIGQDDDVLLPAGGRIRGQQLLGHMDTGLLVGAAVGVGGVIHGGLEGRQLIGRVEAAVAVRRSISGIGDDGDTGSAVLRQQLVTEGLGGFLGVGELGALHTAGAVDDQNHVGGGLVVLALDGQGELIETILPLHGLGFFAEVDRALSRPHRLGGLRAAAGFLALGEGWQGHQRQGHYQRQHKGQRLFPFLHILVPPIAFICAVRIIFRP